MDQTKADALLQSIVKYLSATDGGNFSSHATDGVHMSKTLASARALAEPTKLCGYFQHQEMTTTTVKVNEEGWQLAKKDWIQKRTPTGRWVDVNSVEYIRLVKAFFRTDKVVASPDPSKPDLAIMKGPIPEGFAGYTNAIGTVNYVQVTNMRAIIRKGVNWQLVTIYPVF